MKTKLTINSKITGYKVITNTTGAEVNVIPGGTIHAPEVPTIGVIPITKDTVLSRPEKLFGATFKIKAAQHYDHGIFITLNHIYEEGVAIPFEIFFNTKNRELSAWLETVSLTVTTLFRTRTDISHLLDEYRTIQDSKGGYRGKVKAWEEKPKYYTSILGEIADVIEHYLTVLQDINDIPVHASSGNVFADLGRENPEELLQEVRARYGEECPATTYTNEEPPLPDSDYPPNAVTCPTCSAKAMVLMDGCLTCVQCGFSKCG
jgi:hypothetical protein